jgi:ketosteroid isomerase-like protein
MTQTNDALAGLREALAAAAAAFVRGNAEPLKALFSHRDDVTILGAFGGFEQGWDLVGPRLDWASSQFRDGVWSCTNLSTHLTEDMACLVDIERTEGLLGGGHERVNQELRVTHVFRREGDDFRIVHRHADPLRPTAPPGG